MKEKITYLMKSEGLTTTRLAEILEIQPSAVSHLVSGRNKPGYDLLQRILRRFPKINPDWLLLDSGEPYRAEVEHPTLCENGEPILTSEDGLFVDKEGDGSEYSQNQRVESVVSAAQFGAIKPMVGQSKSDKSPIFVVVFYSDGSCENFSMR